MVRGRRKTANSRFQLDHFSRLSENILPKQVATSEAMDVKWVQERDDEDTRREADEEQRFKEEKVRLAKGVGEYAKEVQRSTMYGQIDSTWRGNFSMSKF